MFSQKKSSCKSGFKIQWIATSLVPFEEKPIIFSFDACKHKY